MVDIDLIVQELRTLGYTVEHVHSLPENAGSYELTVNGASLTLAEARALLEPAPAPSPLPSSSY